MARRIVQNYRLVWLVEGSQETNNEIEICKSKVQKTINHIDIFVDPQKCFDCLRNITDEKTILIVPGFTAEFFVPRVHGLEQIQKILIFSSNESRYRRWTKNWPKVVKIFSLTDDLLTAIRSSIKQIDHESIEIKISPSNEDDSTERARIKPDFMYMQLLKEILVESTEENDEHLLEEFIAFCRETFAGNSFELENIDRFEREFHAHTPIWWYTFESFLYPMLNRSLRLFEADLIMKMEFFIRRLHRQIEQLHKEQYFSQTEIFKVYRGQILSKNIFDNLQQSKRGFLTFHNFLSTSLNRKVSLNFARSALKTDDMVRILFEISVDPKIKMFSFALLNGVSFYDDAEQEILFAMNSVFRIGQIELFDEANQIWSVHIALTDQQDEEINELTAQMRSQINAKSSWERMGLLFIKSGHFDKGIQIYQTLVDQNNDDLFRGYYYHQLGCFNYFQSNYQESAKYHHQALELRLKCFPENHPHIAASYNGLGSAYYSLDDLPKALFYYEQALRIREASTLENPSSLSTLHNNIASLYCKMNQFDKALKFFEKSIQIDEATMTPNHPDLLTSYSNIAGLYNDLGFYDKALALHKKSLDIRQTVLLQNHPDLIESHNNLAGDYILLENYQKALEHQQIALELAGKYIPENHPITAQAHQNMSIICSRTDEQQNARFHGTRAVEIAKNIFPDNHPTIELYENCFKQLK